MPTYSFFSNDKTFLFEATFSETDASVSLNLSRTDQATPVWEWQGVLTTDSNVPFSLSYDDHIDMKGITRLYQNSVVGLRYIWLDAEFGLNHEQYFEGCVFQYPMAYS